ncbi:MAG: PilC/PilY family type IV pilus protein, partial [Noviherbaspirillum sp.]
DASAALFLLSLDKPASAKWQENVNYYKFRVPSKDSSLQSGLNTPALVIGAHGAVRYAYAGDLQGNLWRFDFTGAAPWSNALANATPMFVARDAKGDRQPISMQPKVVFAPGGGYVVLFGTGKFVEDADAASGNFSTQSFYGIYDANKGDYTVGGRSELMPRILEKSGADAFKITGADFSYGSGTKDKKGWYFDFADSAKTGERAVTNALVANGLLFLNSLIPGSDPCAAGGGRSYILNTLSGIPSNGDPTGYLSLVGMVSSPVPFETGAKVSDRNAKGQRLVTKRFSVVDFGTGGEKGTAAPAERGKGEVTVPAGRFSWREVLNWQELRNALKK